MKKFRKHPKLGHPLIGGSSSSSLLNLRSLIASALQVQSEMTVPDAIGSLFPQLTSCSSAFRDAYLVSEILSKYPFEVDGLDRASEAIRRFQSSEAQCSLTNSTVRVDTRDPVTGVSWFAVLETARRKISNLLDPLETEFSWDQAEAHCGVGPGATTSLPRASSDAYYKFGHKPDVTQDCALLAWCAVYRIPVWFETLTKSRPTGVWVEDYARFPPDVIFNIVPGNRVTTVPKNAKTDRVIAIEPDLNMYLQKGLGGLIRRRLRRVGVDLNDQTNNQRLAREGSLDGRLATVDFSSASDTISKEIVEELLPPAWLLGLKQTRSPCGVLPDGSICQYEKFSSMGNGYTFELESLIFWALAQASCDLVGDKEVVSVYGDDLIVSNSPKTRALLSFAFSRAGFTLNEKKSFWDGPFRESCGKHFYNGDDVTPFYIKHPLRTAWDVYTLANNIRRWSRLSFGLDSRLKRVYDTVVDILPTDLQVKIPDGFGDVGLIADWDESLPVFDRGLQQWRCRCIQPRVRKRTVTGAPLLTKWFHTAGALPSSNKSKVQELPRVVFTDYSVGNLVVRQWQDFGPWL